MNTIKIYLAESGRVADLHKDFPLYQGQFQDKLLNVYVPTSILAPDFEIQHYIGQMSGANAPTTAQLDSFVEENTYPRRFRQNGDVVEFYWTPYEKFYQFVFRSGIWYDEEVDSFGTFNNLAGTSVKIGVLATKSNGTQYKSKSYFMRYLKTLTYNNVEYALYERKLPKEFTTFAGQGANAPILVANVVNVNSTDDTVLSIITSQTCGLDVMKSTMLDQDETIEASDFEILEAELNTLSAEVDLKQDKTDNTLNTTNKTVVGAINGLNSQVSTNTSNIATNTNDISDIKAEQIIQNGKIQTNTTNIGTNTDDISGLKTRVSTIENTMSTGENYIGTLSGSSLPTSSALSEYVETQTGEEPKNGDTIIYILQVSQGTDKNYKYIYGVDGWTYYEIPPMEEADNDTYGIIKGTYANGLTPAIQVDISSGVINSIYVVDNNSTKRALNEYLNTLNTQVATNTSNIQTNTGDISTNAGAINTLNTNYGKILSGETAVGLAEKANKDGNGNNIVSTYLTQSVGVTKTQMKEYALPRVFNDVSYLTSTGFSDTIPSGVSPIYTLESSSVGQQQIFSAEKTFSNAEFELSQKNSYTDYLYVAASVGCTPSFVLTTEVYINNEWVTLCSEYSSPVTFVADTITKVTFSSTFNYLTDTIDIADGSKIRQKLYVVTESSETTTFSVYSNSTYPSQFYLNTTSVTINVRQGYLGEIPVYELTGTETNSVLTFDLPEAELLHDGVFAGFVLNFPVSTAPTTTIKFKRYNDEDVEILTPENYKSKEETQTSATLGDLGSLLSYSGSTTKQIFMYGMFRENDDTTFSVVVDMEKTGAAVSYITKNAAGDPFATKAELTNASTFYSGGVIKVPTTNDYCLVVADISQATAVSGYSSFTTTDQYVNYHILYNNIDTLVTSSNKDSLGITAGTTPCYYSIPTTRYIYQTSQWEFQYIVNDTSLTDDQIKALNSGITKQIVDAIPTVYVSSVNGNSGVVTGIEVTSNKVTSVSNASTDDQYPSAKCLYDLVGDIDTILTTLNSGTGV